MAEAFIYDAVRTPRGRGKKEGSLYPCTPLHLVKTVLQGLAEAYPALPEKVEDVILGCVMPVAEQRANIARTAVLSAGYPLSVAGAQVNRFCGSGLEAVSLGAAKVMSGMAEVVIGGGVESMSRVPMGADGGALTTDPSVVLNNCIIPQGIAADLIASLYGYTREQLDGVALRSHRLAAKAQLEGAFDQSIIPVRDRNGMIILEKDEMIRSQTSLEALAALKPSFEKSGQEGFDALALHAFPQLDHITHCHTAGNSSGIADGAAAVVVGTKAVGKILGKKPRAKIRSFTAVGSHPTLMLTGPLSAAEQALKKARMSAKDIDIWEVNEAFAVVFLLFQQHFNLSLDQMNVHGGAIALGHPLGATGAMLVGTVLDILEQTNKQTALITLCVAGGMGSALILERV